MRSEFRIEYLTPANAAALYKTLSFSSSVTVNNSYDVTGNVTEKHNSCQIWILSTAERDEITAAKFSVTLVTLNVRLQNHGAPGLYSCKLLNCIQRSDKLRYYNAVITFRTQEYYYRAILRLS